MAEALRGGKQKKTSVSELDPLTRKALDYFVADVLKKQKGNILKIVLFGSVARGEENEDSDIDVFLLLRKDDQVNSNFTNSALEADRSCNYDTLTSPLTMSIKEYVDNRRLGMPIVKNIEREGIVLYVIGD